ncbi:NAD(P)-dependent dehydrogenase (short-subunit alcohol dehydrogenase family) [Salinibacterium sp. CAN_S4]|uniref:SDR family oxidoreductase n=1 Tax=Salinibacterium sp. CAN_S4 TaxID=2787727 RepID=UPI0018EF6B08
METLRDDRGVAVVTGGSAGLGRAIVRELAGAGWDVAILARGEDGLAGAVADARKLGARAMSVSVDVADSEKLDAAASAVESELGPIELWVNDAMVGVFGEFLSTDPKDFERATFVNYFGFVNGTRAALKRMVPRNRGHVIQVGSALAHRGIPLQAAYCGAKHAVLGFTESVITELVHNDSSVQVSMVDMPALNTIQFNWVKSQLPHHPMPVAPIFQPEVGARAILAVAEKPRRRTWVGESTVATILGNRFGANLLDRYLAKTGYDGQQAPQKSQPMLPDNLYAPIAGDQGAHGIFDDEALDVSPQVWAISHRPLVAAIAGGLGALGAVAAAAVIRRR